VSMRPRLFVSSLIPSARDDMAAIMDPPIAETCHRIGQHLSGLTLQVGTTCRKRAEIANRVGCDCSWRELGSAWNGPTLDERAERRRNYPA
jgi:hypothetical protein